jgi:predicted nucleotide-binding protein
MSAEGAMSSSTRLRSWLAPKTNQRQNAGQGSRERTAISPMQRQIFVGSSSEALDSARHICEVLSRDPGIRCVEWREIFQPGFLTFEALEMMLQRCCGAVFVASPDDATTIREKSVKSPRANIMLEFGLVAGRLGRHNIALCLYGGAVDDFGSRNPFHGCNQARTPGQQVLLGLLQPRV